MAGRAVGHELHQVGAAIPDLPDDGRALDLDPGRGAGQRMQATRQVGLPGADLEVEIVLAVPRRDAACRRVRSLLREALNRMHGENQAAEQDRRLKTLEQAHHIPPKLAGGSLGPPASPPRVFSAQGLHARATLGLNVMTTSRAAFSR